MLAPTVVDEVRRLLADDALSHRQIARLHRREPGDDRRPLPRASGPTTSSFAVPGRANRWSPPSRPSAVRAAGAWSISPAAIAVRGAWRRGCPGPPPRRATEPPGELLGLRLKDEHRLRYEAIHEAKRRAGEERSTG